MVIKWSGKVCSIVLALVLLFPATGSAYSTLYVLGDSLSDVGNLLDSTAKPPLSGAFAQPLPVSPPYFNGRFSDGPIYAEYLWKSLGFSGSLQASSAGGTDYAVGGARSRYHAFDFNNPTFSPIAGGSSFYEFSLLGQRDALLSAQGGLLDPAALYTVWEGSNDVSDALSLPAAFVFSFIEKRVRDLVEVVTDLVAKGARHLLLPNVPNLGLVPEVVALGVPAQASATRLSALYNGLVDAGLAGVAADIARLDTFAFLTDLVADPGAFGLPGADVSKACFSGFVGLPGDVCDDPANHVFWDKIHPSAVVHQRLGPLAFAAVPEPASIALMALALLALGYWRRNPGTPRRHVAGHHSARMGS